MRAFAYILFLITGGFALFVVFSLFFSEKSPTISDDSLSTTSDFVSSQWSNVISDFESEIALLRQEIKVLKKEIQDTDNTSADVVTEEPLIFSIPSDLLKSLQDKYTIDILPAKDVFGFYMFGDLPVTTYAIRNARIYVFGESYGVIRKNLDLAESIYSFNQTDTFFGRSYFLNSRIDDGVTRFIFEYSGVTMGVEILASEYEDFKNILLNSSVSEVSEQ